jgi:hypothetical protein
MFLSRLLKRESASLTRRIRTGGRLGVEDLEGRKLLSTLSVTPDVVGSHIGSNAAIVGQHIGTAVAAIQGNHIGTNVV